jgi:hypothetical protein
MGNKVDGSGYCVSSVRSRAMATGGLAKLASYSHGDMLIEGFKVSGGRVADDECPRDTGQE